MTETKKKAVKKEEKKEHTAKTHKEKAEHTHKEKAKTVEHKEHKKEHTPAVETKVDDTHKTAKTEHKEEVQKKEEAHKTEGKEKKTIEKKVVVKKFIAKIKKNKIKKSKEALETQKRLKEKKGHPTFRGRFGKKNIRRKSIDKWNKWRKSHGIDLNKGMQHGFRPKIGYRGKKELRGIHPSGYIEVRVENTKDLEKIDNKIHAARIGATVGKRKRNEIIAKANEKNIWVLN